MTVNDPEINLLIPYIIKVRRYLHMHPEVSLQEYNTSVYIKNLLDKTGIDAKIVGNTGVVGTIINSENYPTVAVRSEIDALPIAEQLNTEYRSQNPGVMHACGHDGIAATTLGLAKLLYRNRKNLKCNVKFIFEPAEEIGKGAKILIKEKVLDNPKVDRIIVFHYGNSQPLGMEIQRDVSTAMIGRISIQISGKSSHWGERQNGIDAISISAKVISAIDIINNSYPSRMPFVIGIGTIHGGIKNNIMADSVELNGTLRAFHSDEFLAIYEYLQQQLAAIEKETNSGIKISLLSQIPPICNSANLVKLGEKVGKKVFSDKCILSDKPFLAGDNASYYFQAAEGLRIAFFAGKEGEGNYPLHNPRFDFNEDIFPYSLATLYNLILSMY